MSFGLGMQSWESRLDDDQLATVRQFVGRVNPSQDWDALLRARPRPVSFSLWTDFCHYWDDFLARYGVVAPYDDVHLLPIDFGELSDRAPRCVNLRPAARTAWFVVDAQWVHRSWRGHADAGYAQRCRAYAKRFEAWMAKLEPGGIEEAIEAFEARRDAYEIVTAYLEMKWIGAARAACEARCPVALYW